MPILNLCLITFLITLLSVKQSICSYTLTRWPRGASDGCRAGGAAEPAALWLAHAAWEKIHPALPGSLNPWQRVVVFNGWLAEYRALQWSERELETAAETELRDARFHLANAELFDAAIGDRKKSLVELDRAAADLSAAARMVAPGDRLRVDAFRAEIATLKQTLSPVDAASETKLAALKFSLDRMIVRLHAAGP